MLVLTSYEGVPQSLRRGAVTIGNFDGVHLGHQRLLRSARDLAAPNAALAITFDPPPVVILRPDAAPRRLTLVNEKIRLLAAAGMDAVLVLQSDAGLLAMSPTEFVDRVIVDGLAPRWIVEGESFGFGRGRAGTVQTLAELAPTRGFSLRIEPPEQVLLADSGLHATVSSSMIRGLISAGRVQEAAAALGRSHAVIGQVMRGAGVGKTLGFPTLNLDIGDQHWPGDGVYAGQAWLGTRRRLAAISIGTRPTFGGSRRLFEVHLLDTQEDLYSQTVRVECIARLRGQQAFAGADALKSQLSQDVMAVRNLAASFVVAQPS